MFYLCNIISSCLFPLLPVERDPCNPEPCLNGGKCTPEGTDYKCSCPLGKGGKKCEAGGF